MIVIYDCHNIIHIVRTGVHDSLPVGAFLHLTVAQQAIDTGINTLIPICMGKTDAPVQAMTQRTCRNLNTTNMFTVWMSAKRMSDGIVMIQ